jgi:hypothetical protein
MPPGVEIPFVTIKALQLCDVVDGAIASNLTTDPETRRPQRSIREELSDRHRKL